MPEQITPRYADAGWRAAATARRIAVSTEPHQRPVSNSANPSAE
jgi:hypothetical protein